MRLIKLIICSVPAALAAVSLILLGVYFLGVLFYVCSSSGLKNTLFAFLFVAVVVGLCIGIGWLISRIAEWADLDE